MTALDVDLLELPAEEVAMSDDIDTETSTDDYYATGVCRAHGGQTSCLTPDGTCEDCLRELLT